MLRFYIERIFKGGYHKLCKWTTRKSCLCLTPGPMHLFSQCCVSLSFFICCLSGLSQFFESVWRQPAWGHDKYDRKPCQAASGKVMMRNCLGPWDAIKARSSQTDSNNILCLEVQGQVLQSWVVNHACQKSECVKTRKHRECLALGRPEISSKMLGLNWALRAVLRFNLCHIHKSFPVPSSWISLSFRLGSKIVSLRKSRFTLSSFSLR